MSTVYYQDEYVTLYHGDNMQVSAWLDCDVMVTDPPYGRAWCQGKKRSVGRRTLEKGNAWGDTGIVGDDDTAARDRVLEAWGERPAVMFGDLMLPPPTGTKLVGVYRKPPDAGFRGGVAGLRRDLEAIYLLGKWGGRALGSRSALFSTLEPNVGNPNGIVAQSGGHPHAKPQDVMRDLIGLTPEGSSVADPFAGSGSTLVAARFLGRRAVGVEVEERFCEMAARRLAQGVLDLWAGDAA